MQVTHQLVVSFQSDPSKIWNVQQIDNLHPGDVVWAATHGIGPEGPMICAGIKDNTVQFLNLVPGSVYQGIQVPFDPNVSPGIPLMFHSPEGGVTVFHKATSKVGGTNYRG